MRVVRVLEAAAEEAAEAAAWYERECTGLGTVFNEAIQAALDLLESDILPLAPLPTASAARGVKRLILRKFPFDVVVKSGEFEVLVIAFANHARRPGYWRDRLHIGR